MSVDADRIVTAAMTELRKDGFKVDEAAAQAPVGTTGKSGLELNLKAIADAVVDEFTEHWTGGGSWGNLPDGDGVPQRVGDVWSMVQDFLTKTAADALYATTSALSTVATSAASALATATTAAAAAAAAMAAIPAAASTAPLMDGVVSVGAASAYARADHRHPTDTSREPAITAGAAGQWWRYDKTWAALSASDVGGLGALATLSQVADAQVASGAAVSWSKISKSGAAAADVGALGATAAASGDLAGNYPSPTVAGLRGYVLPTLSTTAGGLRWSGTAWALDSTVYLSTTAAAAAYQVKLTTGTTAQYLRGDLSLATFPTTVSAFTNDSGYITSAGSISGNAATATKLSTARTIAATGDGTWSVTFDGSANVSSALTVSGLRGYVLPTLSSTAGGLRWSGTAWALDSTAYLSTAVAASVYLPLAGGTMNAGAKILTLQDMTINTGANVNYSNAPFVAQRYTSDSTTTTHASIGFHNRGVNAAALYYSSQYAQFWYNDHNGGVYHLWDSKDFASQSITNWTTAYNWGNHASAGYLLSSTAASTYQTKITTGTTAQYLRGDLSLATFPTTVSGFTNDSGYITSAASISGNAATATKATYLNITENTTSNNIYPILWCGQVNGDVYRTLNKLNYNPYTGLLTSTGGFSGDLTGNATTATTASAVSWGGITSKPSGIDNVGVHRLYRGDGTDGYWLSHSWSNVCSSYFGSNSWYLTASNSQSDSQGGIHTVLVDYAGTSVNALYLGGVASDNFVRGTGYNTSSTFGHRTTCFNYNGAAASSTCLTDPLYSGFYDGNFNASQTPNNNWAFVVNTTHSNTTTAASRYSFQIAASFDNGTAPISWGGENYWMRVNNSLGIGPWRTLIHSNNYPSFNNFTNGIVAGVAAMGTVVGQTGYAWFGSKKQWSNSYIHSEYTANVFRHQCNNQYGAINRWTISCCPRRI